MLDVLAAAGDLNTNGITDWVGDNILRVVLLFIGLIILVGARKGDVSRVMTTVLIVIIGLMVAFGSDQLRTFATGLVSLIFGG